MHILLVEDEALIAAFIREGLEEEGCTVTVTPNGAKAVELAQQREFDLILLDWVLPERSGIEVCTELRGKGLQTPIIFLTAKDTLQDTVAGLKAGANDYIKKPFHFEELLARVQVYARKKADGQLTLGPIRVERSTYRVFCNEEEVKLTKKEFELLEFLMQHKNTVCSRDEIIRKVWDIHFEYESGVIDVYMNGLRKKIPTLATDNLIQTVRGVGFIARDHAS